MTLEQRLQSMFEEYEDVYNKLPTEETIQRWRIDIILMEEDDYEEED